MTNAPPFSASPCTRCVPEKRARTRFIAHIFARKRNVRVLERMPGMPVPKSRINRSFHVCRTAVDLSTRHQFFVWGFTAARKSQTIFTDILHGPSPISKHAFTVNDNSLRIRPACSSHPPRWRRRSRLCREEKAAVEEQVAHERAEVVAVTAEKRCTQFRRSLLALFSVWR